MADDLIRPFVGDEVGQQQKAPAIPSDLDNRDNFRRENLGEYLDALTTVENLTAPAGSAQAVLDGGAETYDLSALEDLSLSVDEYEGVKNAAATKGSSTSGSGPALAITTGVDDDITVALHGEAGQQITLGTQANGADIAAAIQSGVQGLTAASAENQEAYDGFTAEYVPPSISTTLALQLDSGVEVRELKLASLAGINRGDVLEVADQAGGPAAAFSVTVQDIFRGRSAIAIQPVTPGEDIEVGALVRKRDDFYRLTSGKGGSDSSVVITDGINNGADDLLLRAADGALEASGSDAVGKQTFRFVAGDFGDPAAATAAEVAAVLNKSLTGAIASDNVGSLRITSRKFGASATIRAHAGVSQAALGLPTDRECGTQTDTPLSIRDAEILSIQSISSDVPGNYLDPSIVRVEGDKLVNVDGTDYSGAGEVWRVTYSPRRAA